MVDDLRELEFSELMSWPSMKGNPPTRRIGYVSNDNVVHDAVELQWPAGDWEVRTRCRRIAMPATYREVRATVDCMDCLANGPWEPWLFDAETYR